MDIKNLTGLEEPLKKLIEVVSEGIGAVGNRVFKFDVAKIKRVGAAEAEVEKGKIIARVEAQEAALEIFGRAEKRFALEQYNKQINLENILVRTREDLSGRSVSQDPVEKDWVMRFLDVAQNISREELQDMLAKILSGEIQKPGSFSYQTLEVIRYLSKKDLERFLKFVAISTDVGVIKLHGNGRESLQQYELEFEDYLDLASIGLFNQSSTLSYATEILPQSRYSLDIGGEIFAISNKQEGIKKIDFGLYVFSNVGKELRRLLLDRASNKKASSFKEAFVLEVQKRGLEIISGGN